MSKITRCRQLLGEGDSPSEFRYNFHDVRIPSGIRFREIRCYEKDYHDAKTLLFYFLGIGVVVGRHCSQPTSRTFSSSTSQPNRPRLRAKLRTAYALRLLKLWTRGHASLCGACIRDHYYDNLSRRPGATPRICSWQSYVFKQSRLSSTLPTTAGQLRDDDVISECTDGNADDLPLCTTPWLWRAKDQPPVDDSRIVWNDASRAKGYCTYEFDATVSQAIVPGQK